MAPRKRDTKLFNSATTNSNVTQQKQLRNDNEEDEHSMDVDVEPQVRIKTNDGKRFTLSKSEASCSNAFRSMIESFQNAPNTTTEYINLQSVNSRMLSKVIEWCQKHCNDETEYASDSSNSDATCEQIPQVKLTDWDKNFLNSMNEEEIFQLMHVANYLNVRGLFDFLCQTIAKKWEGMKVEDLRSMYNIENDFKPDEEHQLLQESKKLGFDN